MTEKRIDQEIEVFKKNQRIVNEIDRNERALKLLISTSIPNHPFIVVIFPSDYPSSPATYQGLPRKILIPVSKDENGSVQDVFVDDVICALEKGETEIKKKMNC